jgi:large subunit ribosomal protein L6
VVMPRNDGTQARAMWGTTRSIINSLMIGVSIGFERKLEITGVGYKAVVSGQSVRLSLGYSHDVNFPIPAGIAIAASKPTEISITGIDKRQVGQTAAEIRALRPPEPYKGKGVKYADEFIFRKEGKKK